MAEKPQQFLTPAELSARFNNRIKESTLANWRSRGKGPPYTKIGGRILYRLEDVIEWERARTVTRRLLRILIPTAVLFGLCCAYLYWGNRYPKPAPDRKAGAENHAISRH